MFKYCAVCYNPDIDKLIYQINYTIDKLSQESIKQVAFGYSCDKNAEAKIETLLSYKHVLTSENRNINFGGEPCLSKFKLQSLSEKINKLTASCDFTSRKDLIIDRSRADEWIAKNPFCVSREKWEKFSRKVCGSFSLDIQIISDSNDCDLTINASVLSVEESCNLTFDIVRNLIPCDIVIAMSVYEEACNLSLNITRTEEECKLDFDILVNENNCNLTFDLYKRLIDCNLSYDIIKTVYTNGCTFTVEGANVMLVSALNKYDIDKFKFNGVVNPLEIKKFVKNQKSEYLKNPKSFIEKLKSDYGK